MKRAFPGSSSSRTYRIRRLPGLLTKRLRSPGRRRHRQVRAVHRSLSEHARRSYIGCVEIIGYDVELMGRLAGKWSSRATAHAGKIIRAVVARRARQGFEPPTKFLAKPVTGAESNMSSCWRKSITADNSPTAWFDDDRPLP